MQSIDKSVIKEHYVPQSILERFTRDGEQLYVYDKPSGKIFSANKRDVAQERYFYDIPKELLDEDADPQMVEKLLSKVDAEFKSATTDLLNIHKKKSIPDDLRRLLSICLVVQIFRTRDFRDLVIEAHTKFQQALVNDEIKTKFAYLPAKSYPKIKFNKEYESLFHNQVLVDPAFTTAMADVLYNHFWIIGTNQTVNVFYTSDNPIVKHHHIKGFTDWSSPGVEIAFPLTPRVILLIAEKSVFKYYKRFDGKHRPIYIDNVMYYNSLQVIHSYRQVYSSEKNFDLSESMCNEKPNLRSPKNERVDVAIVDNPLFKKR